MGGPLAVVLRPCSPGGVSTSRLLKRPPFPVSESASRSFPSICRYSTSWGSTTAPRTTPTRGERSSSTTPRNARRTFRFADGLPGTPTHAFHGRRTSLDTELLQIAKRSGAKVWQTRANSVEVRNDLVRVATDDGDATARYVIDASGPSALIGRQKRAIRPIRGFGIAAAFSHYTNLSDHAIQHFQPEGNITILMHEQGWAWAIPLTERTLSVGLVSRTKSIGEAFHCQFTEQSPYLAPLLQGASRGEVRTVGNFSFANDAPNGARYCCIGDAGTFLDPVFSSGISLALQNATRTSRRLLEAFADDREGEPSLVDDIVEAMHRAYGVFGSLIHAFYNTRIVDNLFFVQDPDPRDSRRARQHPCGGRLSFRQRASGRGHLQPPPLVLEDRCARASRPSWATATGPITPVGAALETLRCPRSPALP